MPTLREKIARLIMVRCGSNLPPIRFAHEDEARVGEYVDAGLIGGVLLFNGVWPATAEALQRLKARSAWPLLVASDLERGAGQQMRGLSIFPHARGVAAANDPRKAVAELATSTARSAGRGDRHRVRAGGGREHRSAEPDHRHPRVCG